MVAKISDSFKMVGSIRTFSMTVYDKLKERITALATNLCSSFGAKVSIRFNDSIRSIIKLTIGQSLTRTS